MKLKMVKYFLQIIVILNNKAGKNEGRGTHFVYCPIDTLQWGSTHSALSAFIRPAAAHLRFLIYVTFQSIWERLLSRTKYEFV